jgi:hypothetical protein
MHQWDLALQGVQGCDFKVFMPSFIVVLFSGFSCHFPCFLRVLLVEVRLRRWLSARSDIPNRACGNPPVASGALAVFFPFFLVFPLQQQNSKAVTSL